MVSPVIDSTAHDGLKRESAPVRLRQLRLPLCCRQLLCARFPHLTLSAPDLPIDAPVLTRH